MMLTGYCIYWITISWKLG